MLFNTLEVIERPIVCLSFHRRITPRIRLAISGYSTFLSLIKKIENILKRFLNHEREEISKQRCVLLYNRPRMLDTEKTPVDRSRTRTLLVRKK